VLQTRTFRFACLGAGLAVGAPLGWLALRALGGALAGGTVDGELGANQGLYLYMLLGCLLAFIGFGAWVGLLADRLAEADARHLRESITDALTGLYNPREFHRRFTEELERSSRSGRPMGFLMLDLDHFKRLNDTLGHATGDEVLRRVGAVLREGSRATDVPCRIGGEEFGVLCPDTTEETASSLADRLRAAIEGMGLVIAGAPVRITASFGVGQWRGQPEAAFFAEVDAALYQSKESGRNQVQIAHSPG
jgi:diguanylate cyclase (GGDEF)-like protein